MRGRMAPPSIVSALELASGAVMMPRKRGRRVVSDDDGDGDHLGRVDEGPSTGSINSNKRVRLIPPTGSRAPSSPRPSDVSSASNEDDNSEDGDDDGEIFSASQIAMPQTQYEIMRDAGFRHLKNTDKDDQQASQKLRQRPATVGDNVVAESGIIESITCYNFMCHERLHVELGPLINFIVGENGSGKSAVLTALTLCLGGKASDTNRGGSLKSFVKEGQEHGSLVVRIKNAGSDAYQHDVYGNSIMIERHFSRSGSSGFKIKSAQGRTVSTKKQEVDEISEWYALQISNPLTVLSQDNARQFLNSASPAQKYRYFVSGVQLEQLDNDYKLSQDTLDKTLLLRDDLAEQISNVKKEMEDAHRLAETVEKNNSLREKARHYRNQLIWSQVVEQEQELERLSQDISDRERRLLQTESECEELSKALIEVEDKLERTEAAREDLQKEQGSFDEKVSTAELVWHTAKKELAELHREERDAYSRLKTIRFNVETYEAKIRNEELRLDESTGSARAEKENELSVATSRERAINEALADNALRLPTLQASLSDAQQTLMKQKQMQEMKRKEILAATRHIQELENSSGTAYDGFDREMARLAEVVASDRQFQHKPLGPIGAHIRLLKPEWSGLLERTLGDALNAFVVRTKRDQSRLSGLIRQACMKKPPPVYIAYGGRIDTADQEPDEEFDTILRVLEFDNDLIRSQLIINNQIEKVILISARLQAEQIMIDHGPPRNVAACICFHDGKGKRGQGLRITNRMGTIGTSPIIPSGLRPRMQSDSARQLTLQRSVLKQLGLDLVELRNEESQLQQASQKSKAGLDAHHKEFATLGNDLRRTQADIERIQMEMDSFEGVDGRLQSLRSELETERAEESHLGSQYGNMRLTRRDLTAKVEEAKETLDAEKEEAKAFRRRVAKADEKIQSHRSMRRIAVSKKNEAFERFDMEKSARQRAEVRRDKKAEEVREFILQAEEVAPGRVHIPEGEDYKSIERKYEKIGEQLAQREARLGATDQQIYDRANETRTRYEHVMKQTRDVDETIASLKRAIEHRLHLWRQFQRQISARVRIQFSYLLSERGFRGKIDLNHRARKVMIQIEPDETRKSSTGRNTRTLSGGEKSFSSICMLLSVWEAIGSPIRCLDEFDVFMDNVNRAISTNMLVDAARRSVSRQYILITPNAIEGRAKLDKDVKIIRMTDPRQRTLTFNRVP